MVRSLWHKGYVAGPPSMPPAWTIKGLFFYFSVCAVLQRGGKRNRIFFCKNLFTASATEAAEKQDTTCE